MDAPTVIGAGLLFAMGIAGQLLMDEQMRGAAYKFWDAFLAVLETNFSITAVAILAGAIGVFIYTPVLAVCGVLLILGLHRSKVLTGKSIPRVQVPIYIVTFLLVSAGMIGVGNLLHEAAVNALHDTGKYIAGLIMQSSPQKQDKEPTGPPNGDSGVPKHSQKSHGSANTIPKEIIEQWKRQAPRQWRKHPLGQSNLIGLQQLFDAGVCDGGVNDLTKETPGTWQNWGLRDAQFKCSSNQLAASGTIDFEPKIFSYASAYTVIPPQFAAGSMAVSIKWYGAARGMADWQVATACVGEGQSLDVEFSAPAEIMDGPPPEDIGRQLKSEVRIPTTNCKARDLLIFRLARRGDQAADTLTSTAHVESLELDMR